MRAYAAVLSMAIASGCVATANDSFIGPSGGQAHTAKCSQSPQACLKTAGDTCRGSYAVLDSHSNAGGLLADVLPGPVTWYSMTYQCGRGDWKGAQAETRKAVRRTGCTPPAAGGLTRVMAVPGQYRGEHERASWGFLGASAGFMPA